MNSIRKVNGKVILNILKRKMCLDYVSTCKKNYFENYVYYIYLLFVYHIIETKARYTEGL